MYKYLKYKHKYLYYGGSNCIKLSKDYNQMIKHLLSNNILYLLHNKDENEHYIYKILNKIYNRYNVKNYLDNGTTKFVYNTYNDNIVFKIIILSNIYLNRFLIEPYFMLKYPLYCNKPFDIIVYTKAKIKENVDKSFIFFSIENNIKLNQLAIITWKEDKAITNLSKNPELKDKIRNFKENFFRDCKEDIEKYEIQDLGDINIGFFSKKPYYKWYDIQAGIKASLDIFE